MKSLTPALLSIFLIIGCSDSSQEAKEDNPIIPKSSSETLKKAKEVEQKLKEAAEKRKAQIENSETD
ncbi:MAG: hypothetical protein HWE27_13000 [Gammaproteobacteria bacterium]|nr:hypothetical protein [Gammaproteobacteria bacterium]